MYLGRGQRVQRSGMIQTFFFFFFIKLSTLFGKTQHTSPHYKLFSVEQLDFSCS